MAPARLGNRRRRTRVVRRWLGPQLATHDRREELARKAPSDPADAPDWHGFEALNVEVAVSEQALEALDRHLVQSALDLMEARRSIGLEVHRPADQRALGE